MAATDYQITATGHKRIMHNGALLHSSRKVSMDSAAGATIDLLARGYISATVTATYYDGDANNLTNYTVTATGANKIMHNGVLRAQGFVLALDALEPIAQLLLAMHYIQ